MSGDYTRFTHDHVKRYSGVRQQQGRVALDSDWNEQLDILKRRLRLLGVDALGPEAIAWRSTPEAFRIGIIAGPPPDLSIGDGRAYADGWLAEHFAGEGASYLTQPFLPDPPPLPASGGVLVFLRLFEREVTAIEDPTLLDPALGGADTTTRTQAAWQVLAVAPPEDAVCDVDPYALFPSSPGRLSTAGTLAPAPDDPCVLPPDDGYRGTVNALYRVEVHRPGGFGTATFKWSRDNASIVSAVTDIRTAGGRSVATVERIGRDAVLRFHPLQWVELTDDHRELMGEPGEMAQILDVDEDGQEITLDRALPGAGGRAFGADADEIAARHTRLIAWSQTIALNPALDGDGQIPVVAGAIGIELGVEATFSLDAGAGAFQVGDYWVFSARTADASVERLDAAPPRGVESRWMQLAAIADMADTDAEPFDCRPWEKGCDCCCLLTIGHGAGAAGDYDDLASAVAALPGVASDEGLHVILCFAPGDHAIPATVNVDRPNLTIRGCGPATRLLPQSGPAMVLAGTRQVVEDLTILADDKSALLGMTGAEQVVQRVELENLGGGKLLTGRGLSDFRMRDCTAIGRGGVAVSGEALELRECRIIGGPLRIEGETDGARVLDCDIVGSAWHGVQIGGGVLGGGLFVYDVELSRCRIRDAAGNGVASVAIDPDGEDLTHAIVGLTLRGNEITGNLQGEMEVRDPRIPFGGVVLGTVYDLVIEDNRIEDNGAEAKAAVCGIFARATRGVAINRNIIRRNGRRAGGPLLPGPQAGVSLREANVGLRRLTDPDTAQRRIAEVDVLPAVAISDNRIEARRGQALWVRGVGRMAVLDNQLHAADILADLSDDTIDVLDQYVGSVFLMNSGLPAYFGGFLAGLGFDALATGALSDVQGSPILTALTVGGQTMFRGNQVRLDLARFESELALASILIATLDDALISGNQTEGVLFAGAGDTPTTNIQSAQDILLADLLAMAVTIRQTDNGLMSTPLLTAFSLLTVGLFNHCADNQATSCIRPIGLSPKSADRDNVVIFPHPTFCPQDRDG